MSEQMNIHGEWVPREMDAARVKVEKVAREKKVNPPKEKIVYTEVSDVEWSLLLKLAGASFPVGHAHKRFMAPWRLSGLAREQSQISDNQRHYLAHIAHRYRRQYRLSADELAYISEWNYKVAIK